MEASTRLSSENRIRNMVIDVGNTLTKVAIFDNSEIIGFQKCDLLSSELLETTVSQFKPQRCILSCVGEFPAYIEELITQQMPLLKFSTQTPIPIKNCYKTPNTLGADRLAAAVGAHSLYPNTTVLAVDSGTAITYEIVNQQGEYLGGAISLGIQMRFKALNTFTSKLPLISFNTNHPLVGFNTETSILSGVLNGLLFEADGYIDAIKAQYSPLSVVFTGGDAFFFDKKLKNSIFVNPNLVLIGLNRILEYNENH